jgi:hypothetical protein
VNRTAFLAAVHELAEQLGRQLFAIVQKQSERARAQALELAKDKLRAELEGHDAQEDARPTAVEAERAPRAKTRPSLADGSETRGHPARRGRAGNRGAHHDGGAGDQPRAPRASRPRQRCRKCVEAGRPGLGHNARTCTGESPGDDDAEEESAVEVVADAERQAPPLSSSPTKSAEPTRPYRCLRPARPQLVPPGWTPENDRQEELADLSMLTILRKTS